MTVTPHPDHAPWLRALAAEPRDPVIVYKGSEFILEVAGTALVRSPAYAKLAVALVTPTAEQATREKLWPEDKHERDRIVCRIRR